MDLLKAEIERKRKALKDQSLIGPDKKYFKRDQLKRLEEEEYWKKQHEKHGKNQTPETSGTTSSGQMTGCDSQSTSVSKLLAKTSEDKLAEMIQLPRKDVIRRLRERNEPITLFGESEAEAFLRLRKLEISEPDLKKGLRNDFQEAMEQVDQNYLQEMLKNNAKPGSSGGDQSTDSTSGASGEKSSADVALEDEQNLMDLEEMKTLASSLGRRRDNFAQDSQTILRYLKFLLHLWGKDLNDRPREVKLSTAGKIAAATYTQTQYYFRPLFRQLRSAKVAEDILQHLIRIVKHMVEREYSLASAAYLEMAIGNAPWPIGVTMVGIHARTGREKISSSNIAHVLNDETQRKYIQALKRVMTFCQKKFATDPSRSMEYSGV